MSNKIDKQKLLDVLKRDEVNLMKSSFEFQGQAKAFSELQQYVNSGNLDYIEEVKAKEDKDEQIEEVEFEAVIDKE